MYISCQEIGGFLLCLQKKMSCFGKRCFVSAKDRGFITISIETRRSQEGSNCPGPQAFQCHQHWLDCTSSHSNHQNSHSQDGHLHTQQRMY